MDTDDGPAGGADRNQKRRPRNGLATPVPRASLARRDEFTAAARDQGRKSDCSCKLRGTLLLTRARAEDREITEEGYRNL